MARAVALLVLAIPLVAVGAAPVPKHLQKEPMVYHPTEVGAKWVYKISEDKFADREVVEVVMAVHELPDEKGVKFVEVGTVVEGNKQSFGYHIAVSEKGLAEGNISAGKFVRKTETFRTKVKPDARWEVQIGGGRAGWKEVHTFRGEEIVEVPAGKFTALRVDTEYQRVHAAWDTWHRWYAPGIGLVKAERVKGQAPPASIMKVLKEFIPADK